MARLLGREPSNNATATRTVYLLLTWKVHREGKYFVSREVYLDTLIDEGEMNRVLEERGVPVSTEPLEEDAATDVPLRLSEYGRRVQVPVPAGC